MFLIKSKTVNEINTKMFTGGLSFQLVVWAFSVAEQDNPIHLVLFFQLLQKNLIYQVLQYQQLI